MSEVILSLDTCVFSDKAFIDWALYESRVQMNVSPVVYMERLRQLKNNPKGKESLDLMMKKAHITVSKFDKNVAEVAAEYMNRQPKVCPTCNKLDWNDVMILAGTLKPASVLVTDNTKDFQAYADENRLMTPTQAMETFRYWSHRIRIPVNIHP